MVYLSRKKQLGLFFIIALVAGIFALVISALLASYSFLLLSLPNLSLGAFFGYKYFTYDKSVKKTR